jgi:hypothetical protein
MDREQISITLDNIGKKIFTADGMLVELLKKMRMLNDRGPAKDYVDHERDLRDFLFDAVRLGAREGARGGGTGSVNNGGNNKWILGIVGVLIAGGIFGLTSAMFTMIDRISKVEAKVDMLITQARR